MIPVTGDRRGGVDVPRLAVRYVGDMIQGLLKVAPAQRLTASQAAQHDYFTVSYAQELFGAIHSHTHTLSLSVTLTLTLNYFLVAEDRRVIDSKTKMELFMQELKRIPRSPELKV